MNEPKVRQPNAPSTTLEPVARRLISTGELADELGVSPRTVARYVQDGLLTPTQITLGGHYRWDIEDVREQARKLREEPSE